MTEGKLLTKDTTIATEIEWNRSAVIEMKIIDECQGCHRKNLKGLEVDTAGGEYGQAKICISCIEDLDINFSELQYEKENEIQNKN